MPTLGCGDKFNNSSNTIAATDSAGITTGSTGAAVSTKVTLSGSVSETMAKPSAKPTGGGVFHSPMSGGDVKLIDSKGIVAGAATIAVDGVFSISVDSGTNYIVKATKGNVCLKTYVEKADADKTVTVDPTSSAIVKVLGKKIGNDKLGDEGEDVSSIIGSTDISAIIAAIKNSESLAAIAQAIQADIATNANYSSTTVSVGAVSTAGNTEAAALSVNITIVTIVVSNQGATVPSAPTEVTATAGNGQVTVSWMAVTGATSYNLYYSTTAEIAGVKVSGITGTSYSVGNLTNSVKYCFTITAVNATGESASSTQVSATPFSYVPKFVYTANFGTANVSAYTINAVTGALTAVSGSPFGAGDTPHSVVVDPSGKFVYVANFASSNVSAYTINAGTGALTAVSGSPFAAGTDPHSVVVDPSGKFLYVANQASYNMSAYTINAVTGALTAVSGSPFATGSVPSSVVVDPSGKFVYVANYGLSGIPGNVSAYTINTVTGALTAVSGSPFTAGSNPISVAVDPSGKFAYVGNGYGSISAFTINASTGALTAVSGSPFAAGVTLISVAVDPSGKFTYAAIAGATNNAIYAYKINTVTGALTAVSGSPFAAIGHPWSVAADPSGKFLYAACYGVVSGYTINASTGELTTVTDSPFTTLGTGGPISVAIAGAIQ